MFKRLLIVVMAALFPAAVFADNCFINGSAVPTPHPTSDPAPSVFTYNGAEKCYFYCTQDIIGGPGTYPIDTIHCYSTPDMYHWTDEGVSLAERNVVWANQSHKLWAPHVYFLQGVYQLVVPETSTDGSFYNFTAHSTTPMGPYVPASVGHLPGSVGNVIDPFCFIDSSADSVRVWLSYRHQDGNSLGFVRMNDSGTKVTGNISNCIVPGLPSGYKEGSWMWKRNGIYFLVFALGPASGNEVIQYSTAHNAIGPWNNRGQLLPSGTDWTIHSGACNFKGQWYIFWHTTTFGGSIFGSERCSGINYVTYLNDSTLSVLHPLDNRGVGVPNAFKDSIQIDRGICTNVNSTAWPYNTANADTKAAWYLSGIPASGGSVQYDSVDFTAPGNGQLTLSVRVASSGAGAVAARVGSVTGTLLGTMNITSTGSATTWATQTGTLSGTTGTVIGHQNLFLVFTSNAANTITINWVKFGYIPTATKSGAAEVKQSDLSYNRTGKNEFVVNVPDNTDGYKIKLFDLRGSEIADAFSSRAARNSLTVSLNARTLASGSYVLAMKSRSKELRIPFTY